MIPCFNQGELVSAAVASVEDSEGVAFELVIVDDGSTDPLTLEVLERLLAEGYRVLDQRHRGVAAARNAGVRAARGRYVLPLDADSRVRPAYLQRATDVLDAAPDVGVVYADAALRGERNGLWRLPEFDLDEMVTGNRIGACAVFRRSLWQQCGGYDENIEVGGEDWDYWLAIAGTGCRFVHLPEVLLDSRVRSEPKSCGLYQPASRRRILEFIAAKHAAIFQPRLPRLLAARDADWLHAEARSALLDRSLDEIRGELDATRGELEAARRELQAAGNELQAAQRELRGWRERVAFMIGTRAWRVRSRLLRLRAALGLRPAS